jgi:hypothetical protein
MPLGEAWLRFPHRAFVVTLSVIEGADEDAVRVAGEAELDFVEGEIESGRMLQTCLDQCMGKAYSCRLHG